MLDYIRAHALAGNWAAGERIVVAVSELPGSKTLIRAAKRLADAQGAPWTAVYIETPRSLSFTPEQRQQVAENMQLAAQLGANVASVAGPNVVEPLKAFLDDVRATQLVVGKSARSKWFELRHGSVVDHLVRETPGVAVHVLPHEAVGERTAGLRGSGYRAGGRWGSPTGYLVSALLVAGFTAHRRRRPRLRRAWPMSRSSTSFRCSPRRASTGCERASSRASFQRSLTISSSCRRSTRSRSRIPRTYSRSRCSSSWRS